MAVHRVGRGGLHCSLLWLPSLKPVADYSVDEKCDRVFLAIVTLAFVL